MLHKTSIVNETYSYGKDVKLTEDYAADIWQYE